MIIKGGSRGGPKWLGRHLGRTDTNERVEVLQLQSPHADLTETFRDWQALAGGTRGRKGLYHANIDPAEDYAMTREQWWRSVEVLERELGFEGQPRAVVLHRKKDREHLHVVWSRTDLETMTLRSDSKNFAAHERASLTLELEFGHEHVPGRHAKRDRERQPEPPKAHLNQAEWQQAERSGLNPRVVKADIDRLFRQSDTGQAFQAALQDAGYVLAKGDRRDFVILDQGGGTHALGRSVKGMRAAALRDFMADVARDDLPALDEARERQIRAGEQRGPLHPDTEKLRGELTARHAKDMQALNAFHETERERRVEALSAEIAEKIGHLTAMHAAALARHDRDTAPQGLRGWIERVRGYLDPVWAKEQGQARAETHAIVAASLADERAQERGRLEAERDADLADLAERHAQQLREQEARFQDDLARRLRDHETHQRTLAEVEERQRRKPSRQQEPPPGPEPPPRAR
jgi:hypothetical protein